MAFASSRLGAQEAIIKPCDLCEEEEDVNWFCKDCAQALCERCKKLHLRSTNARNHEVLSISEGFIMEKRNISNLCDEHIEIFSLYCRTCKKNICTKCLLQNHKKHDFVDLREVQGKVQKELNDILKQKVEERKQIDQNIDSLTQYEKNFDSYIAACYVSIDERVQAIKDTADAEGEKLKSTLGAIEEEKKKITGKAKDTLKKQIDTYDRKTSEVERELRLQTTATMTSYVERTRSEFQALTPNLAQIPDNMTFFTDGSVNAGQIGEMVGRINKTQEIFPRLRGNVPTAARPKMKVNMATVVKEQLNVIGNIGNNETFSSDIYCVCCTRDGDVWVGGHGMVYKFDMNGVLVTTTTGRTCEFRDYICYHIASFTSGDAVVSYGNIRYIDRFTSDGKRIFFADMSPGVTYDIAVTDEDHVVVNVNNNSLVILSEKGQKLREIKPDVEPFITFCVMQDGSYRITEDGTHHLVNVDKDGKVTRRQRTTKSDIAYITCDRHGNVIASNEKDAIYVISEDGEVARTYQIPGKKILGDLAVDNNGRLLIVTDKKTITVAEYME